MSRPLLLRRFCDHRQELARWRHWPATIVATLGCLASLNPALAQDSDPVPKPAAAKEPSAKEQSQVRDREKLFVEHQRLLAKVKQQAQAGEYAEAIKTSQQRESVLLELAKFPDLKASANRQRINVLQDLMHWQWITGQVADTMQTSEQRLQLIESEFGAKHWQSASARFARDYYRKLTESDESTRHRVWEMEQQCNSASAKGDYREAIAKADALKVLEAQLVGVEHPFYANSLAGIARWCLQLRDYERAAREWQAALTIRRNAYGEAHPEMLDCHDGLAAVARQQRQWDAAHAHYDRAAAPRRQLFGTISPNDSAVWLDDFATDSRDQYNVLGGVRWDAGQLTFSPGSAIRRTITTGSAWELRLDLKFPPATTDGKPAMARFEFALAGTPSFYAVVWKTEQQDGKTRTRLQFVEITPTPAGRGGLFADEKVKVLQEAEWPQDPSGRWLLNWNSGLLQVRHGTQMVFEGYIDVDSDAYSSAWVLRSYMTSLAVMQLKLHGVERQVFSAESSAKLAQAREDHETASRMYQENKFTAAEPLNLRALKIREQALGLDHPDTAVSLNNLARLYAAQGNDATAEPLYLRALKIREQALGPDHPDTAVSLNNLAVCYQSRGNYADAERLYLRALKILENALGLDHPETARTLNNLAALYGDQENNDAAEPLYQRALKIYEKALGPDHPDTANALNNLGTLYESQVNYDAAELLYQRALKINEQTLGPEHPSTATSLDNLAALYEAQGNFTASEPLGRRALEIRARALGPDHPDTAKSLNRLAMMYSAQGNYAAAEPLFRRSLRICEKALGPDHPDTAKALNNLGTLYESQENYTAAEQFHQRALTITEKALGSDHSTTARCLNNLAYNYSKQRNYAAAEPLFHRALKVCEKTLGPEHPQNAASLNNLASLYEAQENYAAAEPLYLRALQIREKALGPDHPTTGICLGNLALFQWIRDEADSAAPTARRALEITLRHLDETATIQTEQQQFLMSRDVGYKVSTWLTVSGADRKSSPTVYRDVLAWKGLITARQQGLRLVPEP